MKPKNKKIFKKPSAATVARLKSIKRPTLRKKAPEAKFSQALENLPRITNETVAEHREEMLKDARKLIYPLKHSRGRIVKISVAIFIVGVIAFVSYVIIGLYKVQSTSTFLYGVTRVVPLPVAKAGSSWVSYENYLFELRHYVHYYETQQQADFAGKNKDQLVAFKKQAMQQVVNDAYVKQLAKQNNVSVTNQEVDDAVAMLREQNRLGNSDQEFEDVLKEFWGWSTDDFRRELRQQLLSQKVIAALDTATNDKARKALSDVQGGADFATVAKQYSDDAVTKDNGGEYTFLIDRNTRDLAPKVVSELFKLQPGQVSGLIDTGYTLEIVKVIAVNDGKVRAAHIVSNYQNIDAFLKPTRDKNPPKYLIKQEDTAKVSRK